MSDVEITLRLPEELVAQAKAAGLVIETITPDVIALLEQRIAENVHGKVWQNIAEQLQGSLTPEEIAAELTNAKAERIARDQRD